MAGSELQIGGVRFVEAGLVVDYMELPTDVRAEGRLAMQHQLSIDAGSHPDYREDVRKLHDRVVRVVLNALEDFRDSEPFAPEPEGDDDDEMGSSTRPREAP